jgi:hypothetical protein
MKRFYILLISFAINTAAWSQVVKTETDPKTGKEIKSAVIVLGNGMAQQLNFFSMGDEKLIEFAEGRILEAWPAKILRTMSINIKLKKRQRLSFPNRYHQVYCHGCSRFSTVIACSCCER